jgi:DNA-binding phage protein
MTLARDSQETVATRTSADPAFAQALLEEAATLYLEGNADTAKTVLHTVIRATIGYRRLAEQITKPRRSLQRILSRSGKLTMHNLAAIFQTLKDVTHVNMQAKLVQLLKGNS